MNLTWENVDRLIKDCLLDDQRDQVILQAVQAIAPESIEDLKPHAAGLGFKLVEACTQHVALHIERLESHRAEVESMLKELPDQFREAAIGGGGGWSLLNMPFTKDGTQWGEQWQADLLYVLAAGLGLAYYCIPDRDTWSSLPGGLPYIALTV